MESLDRLKTEYEDYLRHQRCEIASNNDPTGLADYLVEPAANNRNLWDRVTRPTATPPQR